MCKVFSSVLLLVACEWKMYDSTQMWRVVPLFVSISGLDMHVGLYHNVRAFMMSVVFIHSLIWKLLLVDFFLC